MLVKQASVFTNLCSIRSKYLKGENITLSEKLVWLKTDSS